MNSHELRKTSKSSSPVFQSFTTRIVANRTWKDEIMSTLIGVQGGRSAVPAGLKKFQGSSVFSGQAQVAQKS